MVILTELCLYILLAQKRGCIVEAAGMSKSKYKPRVGRICWFFDQEEKYHHADRENNGCKKVNNKQDLFRIRSPRLRERTITLSSSWKIFKILSPKLQLGLLYLHSWCSCAHFKYVQFWIELMNGWTLHGSRKSISERMHTKQLVVGDGQISGIQANWRGKIFLELMKVWILKFKMHANLNVLTCYLASFKSSLFNIYFNAHVFPIFIMSLLMNKLTTSTTT